MSEVVPLATQDDNSCARLLRPRAPRAEPDNTMTTHPRQARSGRSVGKAMTSRMLDTSPSSMSNRSMPRPKPDVGGSAVLEGAEVVLVDHRGLLVVSGLGLGRLLLEAGPLLVGIDQLGEAVAQLAPGHHRLVALDQLGPVSMAPGQRATPRPGSR